MSLIVPCLWRQEWAMSAASWRKIAAWTAVAALLVVSGTASLFDTSAPALAQISNQAQDPDQQGQVQGQVLGQGQGQGLGAVADEAQGGTESAGGAVDGPSNFGLTDSLLNSNDQLLIEADSVVYDFDQNRIALVGQVRIYYGDYVLRAARVTVDQATGRIQADGGVTLTEPGGTLVQAADLDVTDSFGEGFIRLLNVETVERTRFTAERADRRGDETEFQQGSYTACASCEEEGRAPAWRIKAKTIIHNQKTRTIYYENATFELWGVPVAYLPFLSHPDPTLRRKSGLLVPDIQYSDELGLGVRLPYYWSIASDMDLLVATTPLSRQGALFETEFRRQEETGAWRVSAAGLYQADPGQFQDTSGDRRWRGGVRTEGAFNINTMWQWGWDFNHITDRAFVDDYDWEFAGQDEAISTAYLIGRSQRNEAILQAYSFRILQDDDVDLINDPNPSAPFSAVGQNLQDKQPVVHPVLDHYYVLEDPILGGELSFTSNLTSLTRDETDAFSVDGTNYFRGVQGTFTRATSSFTWQRTLTDPIGQRYTPFLEGSADVVAIASADNDVANFNDGDLHWRGMGAIGVHYSYPIMVSGLFGTHVFEPVAQVIARPNESLIGDIPNEDAQSLVFDDTTLFDTNKFSGFDRVEGGTRANLGLQLTSTLDDGTHINALLGRSLHLDGRNSFDSTDILSSTLDSGLESDASDWVARALVDTRRGVRLGARGRFDRETFAVNRAELQGAGIYGPLTSTLTYAFLRRQPNLGATENRHEILTSNNLQISDGLRLFGSLRYDLEDTDLVRNSIGLGFSDESVDWSVAYTEDRTNDDSDPVDRTVYFRLGLRTLGNSSLAADLGD